MTRRLAATARPVTKLGFTCFRLVAMLGHDPDEPPFQPVRLTRTTARMFAFMRARPR